MYSARGQLMARRACLRASLGASAFVTRCLSSPAAAASNTLAGAAASRHILAGSAVSNRKLHDPALAAILAEQCSIIVAENEMKWDALHPEQDRYDFTAGDELATFAEEHGILLRGHNLCWHDAQPPWLTRVATSDNAARLLEEHIASVAGHYAGRIHSWDVVNEAIEPSDGRSDGLRTSLWLNLLGADYIGIAFRAAAKADPQALLTYNDYGLEGDSSWNDARRAAAISLLRWMRQNHIPIHALGLQSHFSAHFNELPDWSGLHSFLKQVAKLKLQVFVTELDVDDNNLTSEDEKRNKEAAWLCGDYLKNVLKHPQVKAILTWGLVTHGSYGDNRPYKGYRALPFDKDLKPTSFFAEMMRALQKP
jgi:endo-1,4-beta-xylanase